eukprot:414317-Rhodomonas_salina.5
MERLQPLPVSHGTMGHRSMSGSFSRPASMLLAPKLESRSASEGGLRTMHSPSPPPPEEGRNASPKSRKMKELIKARELSRELQEDA